MLGKYLITFLFIVLACGICLAGCSQPPQTKSEVTAPPSPVGTMVGTNQATEVIPVTTPSIVTATTEIESPPTTSVPITQFPSSRSVPISYQAIPLIFIPHADMTTCSQYKAVMNSPCDSFFTWPNYIFTYRSIGNPITIPINTGAYQAIKYNLTKMNDQRQRDINENKLGNYTYGGIGITVPLEDQALYYNALINDPAQEASYDYTLNVLRKIRDQNHLDANEYAEMISLFVQRSVSYSSDPNRLIVKYPLETIGDKGGDCDDKSLLLAGLLSREGYGTALIWFPSAIPQHMIVGILGDHHALEYDGYLGIETTVDSYLGFYHTKDSFIFTTGNFPEYMADYKVIKISDGKPYTAGRELGYIWDQWALFKGYASQTEKYSDIQYAHDYDFIITHIDDRHMVYQYLTKTGNFQ